MGDKKKKGKKKGKRGGKSAPTWTERAEEAIRSLARKSAEFTTDDVWARLDRDEWSGKPRDPRILGSLMLNARDEGIIHKTGEYVPSERRKMAPVAVWRG